MTDERPDIAAGEPSTLNRAQHRPAFLVRCVHDWSRLSPIDAPGGPIAQKILELLIQFGGQPNIRGPDEFASQALLLDCPEVLCMDETPAMPDPRSRRPIGLTARTLVQARQRVSITEEQAAHSTGQPDGRMPRKREDGPKFTLKNGDQVDALWTIILYDDLVAMRDVHPHQFASLLALAQGRPDDVAPEHLEEFKEEGFLDRTGTIKPDVKSVLLSSHQVTPEGSVLTHPVRLESTADRVAVERVNAELNRRTRDFVWGRDDEGPSLN